MLPLHPSAAVPLCVALMLACSPDEHGPPYDPRPQFANTGTAPNRPPALDSVTHVRLSFPRPDAPYLGPPWRITEANAIRDLVTFVERRDSLWRPMSERGNASFPGPIVFADLYRGSGRVATLTYRWPVELGIEAKYATLFQILSPAEVDTLVALLHLPIRIVPVPPRDTVPGPPRGRRTATTPQN